MKLNDGPDYRDQVEYLNPIKFGWQVHIIGMGAIGSAVFMLLITLGIAEIHIWDADTIEWHNLPTQRIYLRSDVRRGIFKVEAAAAYAERQEATCRVIIHPEDVTADTRFDGIVISGVDSMDSRKAIWEAIKASRAFVPYYMDGRIGGTDFQLLTVAPNNLTESEIYETDWLFEQAMASEQPCGARSAPATVGYLANAVVSNLTLYYRKEAPRANNWGNTDDMCLPPKHGK